MFLKIKHSISRDRATYGCNIVTLLVPPSCLAEKPRRYSCIGAGYDIVGTCLSDFISREYQSMLVNILCETGANKKQPPYGLCERKYGASQTAQINSGIGLQAIKKIASQIGVVVTESRDQIGDITGFYVDDSNSKEMIIA
jgi:hypothetical protein